MAERYGNAITFKGWEGGDYGILTPDEAGRSEKQMFAGDNVLRYRTGLLGPRPGLKPLTFTSPPDGKPLGAGTTSTSGIIWVLTETGSGYEIREWDITAGTVGAPYSGSMPSSFPFALKSEAGTGTSTWISVAGAGVYELNHTANTISLTDADPGGFLMTSNGIRALANDGARLWFSDANDFDVYGPNSYVDVSGFSISFAAPFRDGLIVGTAGGIFHMITGVLGASTNVRELSRGGSPISPFHALRVADDKVWFYNQAEPFPSMFNGSIHQRFDYLETGAESTFFEKLPSRHMVAADWLGTNDWVGYGDESAHIFANDVFTKHSFSGLGDGFGAAFSLGDHHLLIDSYGTGDPLEMLYFAPGLFDRPAFDGDDWAMPGDGSTTPVDAWFSTPEWWDEQGHQVRVQQVIVDYVGWDCGAAGNAGFTVQVDMLHRWAAIDTVYGTPVTGLDEPQSSFSSGRLGTTGRAVVNVSEGFGGGFQVTIADIACCAIKSVTVVLSAETMRQ